MNISRPSISQSNKKQKGKASNAGFVLVWGVVIIMKCEFVLCLYNENLKCTVKNLKINSLGMCDECIIVSIDDNILQKEKKRQIVEMEK